MLKTVRTWGLRSHLNLQNNKHHGFFRPTLLLGIGLMLSAQAPAALVQLKPNITPEEFEWKHDVSLKAVAPGLRLYETIDRKDSAGRSQSLRGASPEATVIKNHKVYWRGSAKKSLSNDPLLGQQWHWQHSTKTVGVNALESWQNFGTGGKNKLGQDLVIAIVDGGFDHRHPDLVFNRWRNWGEIANNGIDDDGNGFIDDLHGWNAQEETGDIELEDHGTHVAGLIGGRGNNNRGGAGVNWRIKLMYVSLGFDLADTVSTLRAYSYILQQKQLWLQTGGKKGANVVAINSSFGIDAQHCSDPDFVVWNQMIDALGKEGILSIAATSNFEINVDRHGDIPTSCDSPYLISVTSNGPSGQKTSGVEWDPSKSSPGSQNFGAGFGPQSIDIAAPGEEILSTSLRREAQDPSPYSTQSGTSFSTPLVAGAVGYLHHVAPKNFAQEAMTAPAETALRIKEALLQSVTPIPTMKSQTQSRGVLNLQAASTFFQQAENLLAVGM